MPQRIRYFLTRFLILIFAATMSLTLVQPAHAETAPFSQPELDQMLAPIALYPDELLTQVLMASTYPLEVVEAARWSRNHPDLKGDQAVRAGNRNDWDPSVLSLLAFPQVVQMMDEHLEWTEQLGDAFLAQEAQVMDTVQRLREKAWDEGYLRSNRHLRVVSREPTIVLEPAEPDVVYVPYYDPMVVYGTWWWPGYLPYFWDWPGYYAGPNTGIYWGTGISIGVGFFFGDFDWPRRHVNVVNINNYYYRPHIDRREWQDHKGPFRWEHDPSRRGNVPYHGFTPRQPERMPPAGERRPFERPQQPPSPRAAFPDRPDLRRDMPVIVNPARRPETNRRFDQRPEAPAIIRPDSNRPPPGVGNTVRPNDNNRRFEQRQQRGAAPRAPEMPVIIRPESGRPRPPEPGNTNRRFEQRQPRGPEMPIVIRPEPSRPRPPEANTLERRRDIPQVERYQIERQNAAPERRPSFEPRQEAPRREQAVPSRPIFPPGGQGGGQER